MKRRRYIYALILLALLGGALSVIIFAVRASHQVLETPDIVGQFEYKSDEPEAQLSDDEAVEFANSSLHALRLDGTGTELLTDPTVHRTEPLCRNAGNPNRGLITAHTPHSQYILDVEKDHGIVRIKVMFSR